MGSDIVFAWLKAGDKLLIVSGGGRTFNLTVRRTGTPGMTFLVVTINAVLGGGHGFTIGQTALLRAADWGDVTTAEAVELFNGKVRCTTIREGSWVSLLQWQAPAGILRAKSVTLIKK